MRLRILVALSVASCQGTPTLPIALPPIEESDLTLLFGYEGTHYEGAYVFDLRATQAPDFDFEVDDDGTIYAGILRGSVENERLTPGEALLGDADTRRPPPGARYLANHIENDAYTGWDDLDAQPTLFSRIALPNAPAKICRYVEVTHQLEVGVIGRASMVVVDPDTVLVSGVSGGMFEVTRNRVTRIAALEDAPSALLWDDGEGAFWSIDASARLAHIERAATGYRWTLVDTATTAVVEPAQGTSGTFGSTRQVAVLTKTGDILFHTSSDREWRRHNVPFDPEESHVNLDVEWVAPDTVFVASGYPEPRRLFFGGTEVEDTAVLVNGPEVDEYLRAFGFTRSDRGLHLIISGFFFTRFMRFDGERFSPDRLAIAPRLPGVAIDGWGDGRLLYQTKGTIVGVDDNDGCVEPRELVGLGLGFPRFLDADHGVVIDQGDLTRRPVRVLFLEFLDGPSRLDP